jgi:hypothetical protein
MKDEERALTAKSNLPRASRAPNPSQSPSPPVPVPVLNPLDQVPSSPCRHGEQGKGRGIGNITSQLPRRGHEGSGYRRRASCVKRSQQANNRATVSGEFGAPINVLAVWMFFRERKKEKYHQEQCRQIDFVFVGPVARDQPRRNGHWPPNKNISNLLRFMC